MLRRKFERDLLRTGWFDISIQIGLDSAVITGIFSSLLVLCTVGAVDVSRKAAVVFLAAAMLISLLKVDIPEGRPSVVFGWAMLLGGSVITAFLSQMLLDAPFFKLGWFLVGLNTACCAVVSLAVFLFSGKWKTSLVVSQFLLIGFTLIDEFVTQGRGADLVFYDIFSAKTALNVISNYHFSVTRVMRYGLLLFGLELAALYRVNLRNSKAGKRQRVFSGVLVAGLILLICVSEKNLGDIRFFNTRWDNGFLLNFTLTAKDAFVKKPDGYGTDMITELEQQYSGQPGTSERKPNIIVIMNESFADYGACGSLRTNMEDVLPFYHSLTENTVKGCALSSIYGGGTPNSEYEFLTGNSVHFLPEGSSAYKTYIKNPTYSMVSELKSLGYDCVAMHPLLASGWNRDNAYPLLGFDEMLFLDDFPQKDLVRKYVSDREMYEKIIEVYEREKNNQDFIFGVTMQNHGGYDYTGENYEKTVTLEGYSRDYPDAEQYLSLLHESDSALEFLIDYFSNVEEDVVIVFFGDHQPSLSDGFLEEVIGKPSSEWGLREAELQYTVPFFIWTNYDSEEQVIPITSLNYLSGYVYDAAEISLPPYNCFLKDLEQEIPAMNRRGYYSAKSGEWQSYDHADAETSELLRQYHCLVYQSLFDYEHLSSVFFPLHGLFQEKVS